MPRNWLQKVCDQLAPTSLKKVERRPRGRIPMRVQPLEVRSLLAAPVIGNPPAVTQLGENIGTNIADPYIDPVTGTNQNNTINGDVVLDLNATDADGHAIVAWTITGGNNPNNAFAIDNNGTITVNNFAAINFEDTPNFALTVTARDSNNETSNAVTVNIALQNRNDVPFITQNQLFTVAENAVAGTVLNGSPLQAFTAIDQNPAAPGTSLNPNDPNFAGGRGTGNVSGQIDSNVNNAGDGVQNGTLRYEILRASSSTVTPGSAGASEVQNISKDGTLLVGQFLLFHTSQLPITSSVNGAGNEVQNLNMIGVPNANRFFTLTFNGQTTRHLHYNSTAAEVQAELELLTTIGAGNVGVTGGAGANWNIEFIGTLQQTNVATIDVTAFTDSLSYSASAGAIQTALTGLPTIGAGNVAVSPLAGNTGWQVQFQGTLANTPVNQIGVLNRNDIVNISSDTPTLGRLTIVGAPDPYLIGSRSFDGQAGLVSGVEFQNAFFGSSQFAVLVRVADRSSVNTQGTNVANGMQTLSYTEYVAIAITDQSESAPQVQDKVFTISEASPNGAVVGKVDEPGDPNDVIDREGTQVFSYAIVGGNTNGAFAINALTSEITVANAAALDFETGPAYRLLVRVTDSASPNLSTIAAMDINLTDFNEPTNIPDGQSFNVEEGSPVGTQLGAVSAFDPDRVPPRNFEYFITNGNVGNTFAINQNTGVITVNNNALLNTATMPSFTLGVRVVDRDLQLSSDVNQVQINVIDVNVSPPIINDYTFSLDENRPNGFLVGTLQAVTTEVNQTVSYTLLTTGTPFTLNSANGQLTVNNIGVDFETQTEWTLVVQASDSGTPSLFDTAIVTVFINDRNELIDIGAQTRTVAEDAIAGTNVGGALTVTDPDDADGISQGKLFTIVSGNIGNVFAINAASGQITVANPANLNFEARSSYSLLVQVNDLGLGPQTADIATMTINVTNANDAPVINDQALPAVIEHRLAGTIVGTVVASDQDVGQTRSFAIIGGNPGTAFVINAATGEVSIANPGAVDFVQNPIFNLVVQVTDAQGTSTVAGGASDTGIVTITVLDADAPTINDQTMLLPENSGAGTVVGNLGLTGGTAPFNFSITSGNTGNTFAVNAAGDITVANGSLLNFETNPIFTLAITVVDSSNPLLTDTAVVTINLTDVNEVPTVNSPTFTLAENATVGTPVGLVVGNDPDVGQLLTYAITGGNTGGAFAINAATGQITVANPAAVNFETNPVFLLNVTATDNGVPPLTSSIGVVTINLTDLNENPVVTAAAVTIPENSPAGTPVTTVVAVDQDVGQTLTYAIIAGNVSANGSITNVFNIDPVTGAITVAQPLALDFENQPPFQLTVRATDNGVPARSGTAIITVNLSDVNDPPRVYNAAVDVQENLPLGALVLDYKIVASDRDVPAQTLTYAITGGNTSGAFAIDAATGLITVANPAAIDAEINPFIDVTIQVTDNGVPPLSSSANLRVNIGNVNDAPVMPNKSVTLPENSPNGTVVTNAGAVDPEGQTLTYAIIGGNATAGGNVQNVFAIDPATGVITVANSAGLDWENQPPFNLIVTATDTGNPVLTTQATIRVTLTNVNDAPHLYNASKTIPENLPAGALVLDYTIVAKDQDAGQTLTFAIIGGNTNNAFVIDPTTGLITVNNPAAMDFETNPVFTLTIQVTDNGTPVLSSTATLTINLSNKNDVPVIPPQAFFLTENSVGGTAVGTVAATDGDPGQTLTFAIIGGNVNGAFAINPATGQIRVSNPAAIDFEANPVFSLTVTATDNGVPAAVGTGVVTVNLLNVNDAPTILPQTFAIAENSAAGVVVGTVIATEADAGQSVAFAIVGGNMLNAFSINAATGVLTVSNPLALNFEATPQFQLIVRATDNGTPALQRTAIITVNLNNVNEAPKFALNNPLFSIAEATPIGTIVGTNAASDPDAGQTLTYAIVSGNNNGAFSIDGAGNIRVANPAAIDFESGLTSFTLGITATDNGIPQLQAATSVAITVLNANDPPVVQPKAFTIAENSATGAFIGTIVATDQDPGQTRTFSITGGNVNGAFTIDPSTGTLSVGNSAALNFETNPVFNLIVTATDSGSPARAGSAAVTVNLLNRNEAPVVPAQQLAVQTRAAVGTVVGTVQATDPDAGQTKTFAIIGGNGALNNAFRINAVTGVITVNNALAVLFPGQYNLLVRATDNASPALSGIGTVQVFVNATGTVPRVSPAATTRTASSTGIVAQQPLPVAAAADTSAPVSAATPKKTNAFLSLFSKKK